MRIWGTTRDTQHIYIEWHLRIFPVDRDAIVCQDAINWTINFPFTCLSHVYLYKMFSLFIPAYMSICRSIYASVFLSVLHIACLSVFSILSFYLLTLSLEGGPFLRRLSWTTCGITFVSPGKTCWGRDSFSWTEFLSMSQQDIVQG